jgi:hypothetical protein
MLHLRACYVSKAAILTVPAFRAGQKSKSRLNSKGLNGRRGVATVFVLRI